MKHIFVINPNAGKKDSLSLVPVIEEYFRYHSDQKYEIIQTEREGHATEIANRYHEEDDVCLYAIGGDGTAFEILNGLNENVTMAVIPNGTGNDYYKMISNKKQDVREILLETIEGHNVRVDYGIANERRYLNASSMGIDADVNLLANKIGKKYPIPKSLVYVIAAIITVLKPKPIDFEMTINGETIHKTGLMIVVMNGRYYGGGFLPTPMADIQDSELDVLIVDDMKVSRIFKLLPMYMKGEHLGMPEVTAYKTDAITLKTKEPVMYGCDGETNTESFIQYRVVKGGLSLRIPAQSGLK